MTSLAYFEHQFLFMINLDRPIIKSPGLHCKKLFFKTPAPSLATHSQPFPKISIPTTSVLTAAILIYARRAGITAAAGTRLALFLFLVKFVTLFSFQLNHTYRASSLLFFVTTSSFPHWVIFAPAATLGYSSDFSCSLFGIEPLFSVSVTNTNVHDTFVKAEITKC